MSDSSLENISLTNILSNSIALTHLFQKHEMYSADRRQVMLGESLVQSLPLVSKYSAMYEGKLLIVGITQDIPECSDLSASCFKRWFKQYDLQLKQKEISYRELNLCGDSAPFFSVQLFENSSLIAYVQAYTQQNWDTLQKYSL